MFVNTLQLNWYTPIEIIVIHVHVTSDMITYILEIIHHKVQTKSQIRLCLVVFILTINLDCAITLRVWNTRQQPSLINFIIIQKDVSRLINLSINENASAGRTSSCPTTVRNMSVTILILATRDRILEARDIWRRERSEKEGRSTPCTSPCEFSRLHVRRR